MFNVECLMFKEIKIMKALRYLLMMVAVMGVLSVSAQTPKYGKTYKSQERAIYSTTQVNPQMPVATMSSTGSALVSSGSSLPQAAVTGTTTADETGVGGPKKGIRRATQEEEDPFGGETIGGTENPIEPGTPIGDAMWPLMLLALAYVLARAFHRKRA